MAEKRKLEFFLLRYVPDAVREEFVNIGLALIESSARSGGFADIRFTRDWRRILCLDPDADLEMLEAIAKDIRKRVVEVRNCEEITKALNQSFSNLIQLSGAKGCLSEDPTAELEKMGRIYLDSARSGGLRTMSGRKKILEVMEEAWESAGVVGLLNPFPIAPYTKPGDSFVFDFAYRIQNELKLFHAVSLKARVDAGVTLAARYPRMWDAMVGAKDPVMPSLVAVVDNKLDESNAEIGFVLEMMRESRMAVSEVREMPTIAQTVRKELGV